MSYISTYVLLIDKKNEEIPIARWDCWSEKGSRRNKECAACSVVDAVLRKGSMEKNTPLGYLDRLYYLV
jgi:hypothetical protein